MQSSHLKRLYLPLHLLWREMMVLYETLVMKHIQRQRLSHSCVHISPVRCLYLLTWFYFLTSLVLYVLD